MLALHRASTALAGPTADTDAVLDEVLRNAVLLVGGTSGSLHRWDSEAEVLRAVSNRDVSERHATPDIRPGDGIVGQTFSRGEPLIVNDYRSWEHARGPARTGKLCAALGVPLMRTGKCLGVLTLRVYGDDPKRFTEDDARIASLFANQATEVLVTADAFEEQRRVAQHDALTGLPNRVLLQQRLHAAIDSSPDGPSRPFALMILDLDRFKEVNDTLGHHSGDALLEQIGPRLLSVLRESDTLARLSGDEFALLLPATDGEAAQAIVQRLRSSLEAPFTMQSAQIEVGGSFGIALYPDHGTDCDTLLRRADMAMYIAKSDGSGWAMYSAERDNYSPDRLALAADLRHAVERDELVLHYQPQVDVRTGRFVSVEALMRWQHPERGLVAPDTFIPLAEQTQLIRSFTRWAIASALKQSAAWRSAGKTIPVAVNLSAHDVQDQGLPGIVSELLREHRASPDQLRLEITEGSLLADPERARENLTALRALGVHIAIDDFGTGYSSLNYLQQLPVDELKIDKSFVQRMATDEGAQSIVRAVIDLAHDLGLGVIAEGVEDHQTWEVLAALGCDMAQGYYFSRPIVAESIIGWIDTPRPETRPALIVDGREGGLRLTGDDGSRAARQADRSRNVSDTARPLAS
jgi:diguanylate cyclase (GGDEF)-like protein